MRATRQPFVSHAQNFEDIVLWRVLQDVDEGCYVDVGACDPIADSISWAFYQRGWRGALIEPVPSWADALRRRRPYDVTIEAAAGAATRIAPLFASRTTGNSTLVRDVADRIGADGIELREVTTEVKPLDDLLEDAGFQGRTIHFCTIDVEGSETEVLAGFDLARWRPWILVVEATEPNRRLASHPAWEDRVLAQGYRFSLFDGLNRFYVHADKAHDFGDRLSYPACVFDEPFHCAVTSARRAEQLERERTSLLDRLTDAEREKATLVNRLAQFERGNEVLVARAGAAAAQLSAMEATISWRVTRPLRAVRARQIRRGPSARHTAGGTDVRRGPGQGRVHSAHERADLEHAFAQRVTQAAGLLLPAGGAFSDRDVDEALALFQEALTSSGASDRAQAWLALVAVDGTYPGEQTVEHLARMLRMDGAGALCKELSRRFAESIANGLATTEELDVRRNRVVVDVTHTAMATDLHTGIQRVVRETVARWIDSGRPMDLIRFDLVSPAARVLSERACERFRSWRTYVGSASPGSYSDTDTTSAKTLVPWQCDLVVPELPFETQRTSAYRGLGSASVLRSLSMVGYDVIPIVAGEKVVTDVSTDFVGYLSVLKHADRVSSISRASKASFEAFGTMTATEGLRPPRVEAHELPTETLELDPGRIEAARSRLGVGVGPVVLVVGSHEPRKNHLAVLEAAERLWTARDNAAFELLFLGWSGWLSGEFDELVGRLVKAGRPIIVRKRCTEDELWAAYRLSRFSVFPSLLEGFGLPIAESLACGTPVITSDYGSMAEVAERGGCVLVDVPGVDKHAAAPLGDLGHAAVVGGDDRCPTGEGFGNRQAKTLEQGREDAEPRETIRRPELVLGAALAHDDRAAGCDEARDQLVELSAQPSAPTEKQELERGVVSSRPEPLGGLEDGEVILARLVRADDEHHRARPDPEPRPRGFEPVGVELERLGRQLVRLDPRRAQPLGGRHRAERLEAVLGRSTDRGDPIGVLQNGEVPDEVGRHLGDDLLAGNDRNDVVSDHRQRTEHGGGAKPAVRRSSLGLEGKLGNEEIALPRHEGLRRRRVGVGVRARRSRADVRAPAPESLGCSFREDSGGRRLEIEPDEVHGAARVDPAGDRLSHDPLDPGVQVGRHGGVGHVDDNPVVAEVELSRGGPAVLDAFREPAGQLLAESTRTVHPQHASDVLDGLLSRVGAVDGDECQPCLGAVGSRGRCQRFFEEGECLVHVSARERPARGEQEPRCLGHPLGKGPLQVSARVRAREWTPPRQARGEHPSHPASGVPKGPDESALRGRRGAVVSPARRS